jgi:hypothetical protein
MFVIGGFHLEFAGKVVVLIIVMFIVGKRLWDTYHPPWLNELVVNYASVFQSKCLWY